MSAIGNFEIADFSREIERDALFNLVTSVGRHSHKNTFQYIKNPTKFYHKKFQSLKMNALCPNDYLPDRDWLLHALMTQQFRQKDSNFLQSFLWV